MVKRSQEWIKYGVLTLFLFLMTCDPHMGNVVLVNGKKKEQQKDTCLAPELKVKMEAEIKTLKLQVSTLKTKMEKSDDKTKKRPQVTFQDVVDTLSEKTTDAIEDFKSIDWETKRTEWAAYASKTWSQTRVLTAEYATQGQVWAVKTQKIISPYVELAGQKITTAYKDGKVLYTTHVHPSVMPLVKKARNALEPFMTQAQTHPMVKPNVKILKKTAKKVYKQSSLFLKNAKLSAKQSRMIFISTLMKQTHPILKNNAQMIVDVIIAVLLLPTVLFTTYYLFQISWFLLVNTIGILCCCFCCGCARKRNNYVSDNNVVAAEKKTSSGKSPAKSKANNKSIKSKSRNKKN